MSLVLAMGWAAVSGVAMLSSFWAVSEAMDEYHRYQRSRYTFAVISGFDADSDDGLKAKKPEAETEAGDEEEEKDDAASFKDAQTEPCEPAKKRELRVRFHSVC